MTRIVEVITNNKTTKCILACKSNQNKNNQLDLV